MKLCIKLIPRKNKKDYDIVVCPKKSNSIQKRLDTIGSLVYSQELKSKLICVNRNKLAWWVYNGAEISKSLNVVIDSVNKTKL